MQLGKICRSVVAASCVMGLLCTPLEAKQRKRIKPPKEREAWIDGKGMCVFPFAADELPASAEHFAAAIERGYRGAMKLPEGAPIVTAAGGTYPIVDTLRIDVCEAVVKNVEDKRKPNERQLAIHGLDAAKFEFLGHDMTMDNATVHLDLTASDARLLFTRDKKGKPLLVLGDAREGRMRAEISLADVERLLLAAAKKGGKPYGLKVDRTRLKMTVEDGRTVRVHLKLYTRLGFVPAGLHFRARLDINDQLEGTLSELSCTGDEVLGPLIGGLVQPFLAKYNGTTRPVMNFPKTDMRLRDVQIIADETIRVSADFGS